jgi:hypothetical protein
MNAPVQTAEAREIALAGMGASRLRKEDARFIQGKGNYEDQQGSRARHPRRPRGVDR